MESRIEKTESEGIKSNWVSYKDLLINRSLFKKGLVVVRPKSLTTFDECLSGKLSFKLNEREFHFSFPGYVDKHVKQPSITKARKLLLLVDENTKTDVVVFNKKRREEVFFGLGDGLYVYPWVGGQAKTEFSGFDSFVTCMCMFGSSLKASDQHGNIFSLIDHHLRLEKNQIIQKILFDNQQYNPYEEVAFSDLSKMLTLVKKYSKQEKNLIIHLPSYDYILFGIKLLINGHITITAFDQLVQVVLAKSESCKAKIMNACHEVGVNVFVQSPFDSLFLLKGGAGLTSQNIFELLSLNVENFHKVLSDAEKEKAEAAFVQQCLRLLSSNNDCLSHQKVWRDFLEIKQASNEINKIEKMFELANSVIVGAATRGKADHSVCSVVMLGEKQIQVSYETISHCARSKSYAYPPVINFTLFESVLGYSTSNNGLLFYFDNGNEDLSELIRDKSILKKAQNNLAFFANQNTRANSDYEYPIKLTKTLIGCA